MKAFKREIKDITDLLEMVQDFKTMTPSIVAIDTEATGLHIIKDKPFLFQFGWRVGKNIMSYLVYLNKSTLGKQTIKALWDLCKKYKCTIIGHNIKFDLHMLKNIHVDIGGLKFADTTFNIRFAHDSLTPDNGGPPLSLKDYTAQYITADAKTHEKKIQSERSQIAKDYNKNLMLKLKAIETGWSVARLDELEKEHFEVLSVLSTKIRNAYNKWLAALPQDVLDKKTGFFINSNEIPYNLVNIDILKEYAYYDIIYTLLLYYSTIDVVKTRQQEQAYQLECDLLLPLLKMERVGFKVDRDYLLTAKADMEKYMIKRRKNLATLLGDNIRANQHQKLKELIKEKYNITLKSTNTDYLNVILPTIDKKEVKDIIKIVQELRTLEKWYSTYLLRFLRELGPVGTRIYTTINQVGTVTGRVTSDFQQFPRRGISKANGTPLFDPRRMVIVTGGEYDLLAYLDYSQIELRFTAIYTILLGMPDQNLCRAYMPYNCYNATTNKLFDYTNVKDIKKIHTDQWLRAEDAELWIPTDVHAATTALAYPDVHTHSKKFKELRADVGKPANFAKNYGSKFNRLKQMFPDKADDEIKRIDEAYYKAFPGIKNYHEYCYTEANASEYSTNLFGVRYYGLNGHKLINCLIQGSSATLLKQKIIEVDRFLSNYDYKIKFQMNIHDELSFEIAKTDIAVLPKIKAIMEDIQNTPIPIVVDMEVSKKSWADKEPYDG